MRKLVESTHVSLDGMVSGGASRGAPGAALAGPGQASDLADRITSMQRRTPWVS
jgi:hypothetical protein